MKNLYLYFSGTGNTKYVVKRFIDLYEEGEDYEFRSIEYHDVDYGSLIREADCIIIAFPIHESMMPFIMSEFLDGHLEDFRDKKLMTICSQLLFSGDGGALPFYKLKKAHVQLLNSIHVNMPSNLTDVPFFFNKPLSETEEKYRKAELKIERVVNDIKSGKSIRDGRLWYSRALGFILQRGFAKLTMYKLKSAVKIKTELCILCNICTKICPEENLYRNKDRIEQKMKCTLCYRCVNECPSKAISIFMKKSPQVQYTRRDYN